WDGPPGMDAAGPVPAAPVSPAYPTSPTKSGPPAPASEDHQSRRSTPSRLLASDPRITEPAWIELATPLTPTTPPEQSLPPAAPAGPSWTGGRTAAPADPVEAGPAPIVPAPVSPGPTGAVPVNPASMANVPVSPAPFVPTQVTPPSAIPAPAVPPPVTTAPVSAGSEGAVRPGGLYGTRPPAPDQTAVMPQAVADDLLLDDPSDEQVIVPWDRRPLLIVVAGALVLVLVGILSGVASASLFSRDGSPATWRDVDGPKPSSTGAPVVPPGPADTVTLSGVGDVIMGTLPGDVPPRNGEGFFDPVKDALAADLIMGNLETPLTEDTGRVKCPMVTPSPEPGNPSPSPTRSANCFQLYLPPSYAEHLRDAGFQVMNLANNHTNDMGTAGLRNTRAALTAAGIRHTGAPGQITYVDVKGVKVAVIGFAAYSWSQSLNNIPAAQDLVRKAAAKADLVVIQMQGGAEGADKSHVKQGMERFAGEDRGDLIKFTHAVVDAGADVVFGHGPHIMRGMEFYKGRLIAYSLGNFCGYGVLSSSGYLGVGGVLKITLRKDGTWAGGTLVPTELVRGGMVAIDAQKRALGFVNGLSADDFGGSAARISTSDGKITPPASA
ncbi:MAG TPA: CapA family protein, partial [Micromonosporaceae bacterium]